MLIKSNAQIQNIDMNQLRGDALKVENLCLQGSIKTECLIKPVHCSLGKH